jgi:hypothetical protein
LLWKDWCVGKFVSRCSNLGTDSYIINSEKEVASTQKKKEIASTQRKNEIASTQRKKEITSTK